MVIWEFSEPATVAGLSSERLLAGPGAERAALEHVPGRRGGTRGAKEATYIFRRKKNRKKRKKKTITEACLAHTPALGAGSGGARGGERLGGWK